MVALYQRRVLFSVRVCVCVRWLVYIAIENLLCAYVPPLLCVLFVSVSLIIWSFVFTEISSLWKSYQTETAGTQLA